MPVTVLTSGWTWRAPRGPFAGFAGPGEEATPVRLPHDALRDAERSPDAPSRGAGAYYPSGAYTYLRTLHAPAGWAGRIVRLEVQGAYRRAQVFVNDQLAGNRADGYARFFVDLTPYLVIGADNEIRVEVRSGKDSRWYSGCGLHRPVLLHVDEPVHVVPDGVRVTTIRVEDDLAVVEVLTRVANAGLSTATAVVHTQITAPTGSAVERDLVPVTVPPGDTVPVRQRFYLNDPALWSPESPALHTATVGIEVEGASGNDPRHLPFGVRTVTVDPQHGLRINGVPTTLRGACIHHDNGPLGAAAIGRAEERRIELLKAAGFNAIRTAHNPGSVALLDACDRLGMLVMDEAFDMWTRAKTDEDYAFEFPQWWREDLASMVAKDANHPSVILYSIGNEIAEVGTPHGSRLAREMAEHLRALDPTRLITNGVNSVLAVIDRAAAIIAEQGLNEMMANDIGNTMGLLSASEDATARTTESHSVLDVVGLNYAEGRYAPDRERFPHRVIVGSETFPSRIGTLWPMVTEMSHVIGDFTWTGWDYLGEVGIGSTVYAEDADAVPALEREYPWLTAWCGDIDITGWRRPASFYREIVFGLRAEPYVAVVRPGRHGQTVAMQSPWAWSDSVSSWSWPGYEGRPVTVEVYTDADGFAFLLDGVEIARTPVGSSRPMLATAEIAYRPGELVVVASRGGVEVGRTTLRTAGTPLLALTSDRSVLRDDDADLAYVAVELRDEDGILAAGTEATVTIAVEGTGALAGMCSANPRTEERFDSATWRTFDGRALAVVRPAGVGSIRVTATAPGFVTRAIELTVEPAYR